MRGPSLRTPYDIHYRGYCIIHMTDLNRLQTKANYFPLRLHIIRLLLPLAKSHDYYVPLATLLLEVNNYKVSNLFITLLPCLLDNGI